ncbi:MAG: hypothetical protein KDB03_24820 [Planctomycetales bacterium]|nr:hypothetical protein [Planctomycetales bacterium]
MRFTIRNLLLVVTVVAVVCAILAYARRVYYADRWQANSMLADVKGISNIQLHSHTEVVEEVHSSSFAVEGHPHSIIEIGGLGQYQSERRFSLTRIGKWTFRVSGCGHIGVSVAATGEAVESDYFGGAIELGPDSPYKKLFPFEVESLQDVVDHYPELIILFETWPREDEPGQVMLEDGTTQSFYVVEETR